MRTLPVKEIRATGGGGGGGWWGVFLLRAPSAGGSLWSGGYRKRHALQGRRFLTHDPLAKSYVLELQDGASRQPAEKYATLPTSYNGGNHLPHQHSFFVTSGVDIRHMRRKIVGYETPLIHLE